MMEAAQKHRLERYVAEKESLPMIAERQLAPI
jgi:hypothetical protein